MCNLHLYRLSSSIKSFHAYYHRHLYYYLGLTVYLTLISVLRLLFPPLMATLGQDVAAADKFIVAIVTARLYRSSF